MSLAPKCFSPPRHHPAVPRRQRERLEATLVHAARHGLDRLREEGHHDPIEHLRGRVAWVEQVHPEHGRRLRRWLGEIGG